MFLLIIHFGMVFFIKQLEIIQILGWGMVQLLKKIIILFVNVNGCGNHFKETSKVCMTVESILPYIYELSNSCYKEEIILKKHHGHD